jgi:DNA-3-methyladenine glycosylase
MYEHPRGIRIGLLDRVFFDRPVVELAQALIGKQLFSRIGSRTVGGTIIETEAYLATGDSACHAARGKTLTNSAMFDEPGTAYIYPIHAKYCFNIVAEAKGTPAAVLIRALEPTTEIRLMYRRRKSIEFNQLASGPGKLCQALGIKRLWNQRDLTVGKNIWLTCGDQEESEPSFEIKCTRRIGVTSAKGLRLRFVWAGHPLASGPKAWR